jgi:hypothetical protein
MIGNRNNELADRVSGAKTDSEHSNGLVPITARKESGEATEAGRLVCGSGAAATSGRADGRKPATRSRHIAGRVACDSDRGAQTK